MRIEIILSSLPQSWNNLVTALSTGHTNKNDLKMRTLSSSLQDEEIRRKINPNESDEKVLKFTNNFNTKPRFDTKEENEKSTYSNSNQRNKPFRHFCKRLNHVMKECRRLKAYNEKNSNSTTHLIQEDDDEYLLSIDVENDSRIYNLESNQTELILDSGATSHTTSDRNLFTELHPVHGKKVKLANGNKVDIAGIGTCKLQLQNAAKATLTNVLLVPEIKGNFKSIPALTRKGFEINFYNEKADIVFNGKVILHASIKADLFKFTEKLFNFNEIKKKKKLLVFTDFIEFLDTNTSNQLKECLIMT